MRWHDVLAKREMFLTEIQQTSEKKRKVIIQLQNFIRHGGINLVKSTQTKNSRVDSDELHIREKEI